MVKIINIVLLAFDVQCIIVMYGHPNFEKAPQSFLLLSNCNIVPCDQILPTTPPTLYSAESQNDNHHSTLTFTKSTFLDPTCE
jgi:hypothetical protein